MPAVTLMKLDVRLLVATAAKKHRTDRFHSSCWTKFWLRKASIGLGVMHYVSLCVLFALVCGENVFSFTVTWFAAASFCFAVFGERDFWRLLWSTVFFGHHCCVFEKGLESF